MSDADTFTFLLTTDNHLGYKERDSRRGLDSFVTFEECLRAARVEHEVDAMLLGGDLFDENKPTLNTLTRTMGLMRKYVMGDSPIRFSILSDPAEVFPKHPVPLANFQDPNMNIALPIFTIHGNHDDPVGGTSAIDILSYGGLLNFFGHVDSVEEIVLKPILLQKGQTRVALYGMGNVRDDRLHRCFRHNKVRIVRPKDDGGAWFNILLFHQNRGMRSSQSKSGIPESMLRDFGMDLVVWGNEHEQLMVPQQCEGFDVTQPGSTIMTSVTGAESNPKQYGILEVRGTSYRLTGHNLKSIRPVVRRTVELWRENPAGRTLEAVEDYLRRVADNMIDEAERLIQDIPNDVLAYHPNIKFPLMRISVDYNDPEGATYPMPNANRFGQQFLNVVVNAEDLLKSLDPKARARPVQSRVDLDLPAPPQNVPTNDIRVKILQVLSTQARDACQLLSETELSNAVHAFIEKQEKVAIETKVGQLLLDAQTYTYKKLSPNIEAGTILEPQRVHDLAFERKKDVNRKASDEAATDADKGPSYRNVSNILNRRPDDTPTGAAPSEPQQLPSFVNADVEPPAPTPSAKTAPKRARATAARDQVQAPPASRGRKKDTGPTLNLTNTAAPQPTNDILSMWNK